MRAAWLALGALVACTRPGDDRARAELEVGHAATSGTTVEVAGGLAAIRRLADGELELWANAPALEVAITVDAAAAGTWHLVIRNAMPDAVLLVDGMPALRPPSERPTLATFDVTLEPGSHTLRLAPPDADVVAPFHVAAMADIQTALPTVDDVFAAISAVPEPRFVVAMGDITERAQQDEYDLFEAQLAHLDIPYFTTLGNHELWSDPRDYFGRYGRASFQFEFKGVAFTFVDSGDAGLDPLVETWLDAWLEAAADRTHVFLTHIPPIDPVGVRYGSFRSTRDGRRVLSRLAAGDVDLMLYGHIHTFIAYEDAGIPAYISGGGGALPMKLDDVERHFLVVELNPTAGEIGDVDLHRVD